MSELGNSMAASAAGLAAQSSRLRITSENIANVDTPGYRGKQVTFVSDADDVVRSSRVDLDRSALERVHDPAHPLAGADGYYDGSNVNLMIEIANAREAQRSYEANLRMFDQARQMSSSLMDIIRR